MTEHLTNSEDDEYVDNRPEDRAETIDDRGTGGSRRGPSRMAAFGSCPTKGRYSYHEGLTLRKDKPFRLGGRLVHLGVAYFHALLMMRQQQQGITKVLKSPMMSALQTGMPMSLLPDWFRRRTLQEALVVEAGPDAPPSAIEQANIVIGRYVEEPQDDLTELFIEHEFEATLGEVYPLARGTPLEHEVITCRSDRVLEDTEGFVWIEDHKTKGRGRNRAGTLPRWHNYNEHCLDWQAMINLHIVRRRLAPKLVRGFNIQRIQRVQPYDRDRNILRVSKLAYAQAPRTAAKCVAVDKQTEEEFIRGEESDRHFWACYDRFGLCDYAPLCAADTAEEREAIISADFRRALTKAQEKRAAAGATPS